MCLCCDCRFIKYCYQCSVLRGVKMHIKQTHTHFVAIYNNDTIHCPHAEASKTRRRQWCPYANGFMSNVNMNGKEKVYFISERYEKSTNRWYFGCGVLSKHILVHIVGAWRYDRCLNQVGFLRNDALFKLVFKLIWIRFYSIQTKKMTW